MNLIDTAERLRTHFNYVFYDKWNYALALPFSAFTTANFYLGRPAHGVRDVLLSLILLYTIGRHRASNQELKQAEVTSLQTRREPFNFTVDEEMSQLRDTLERTGNGILEGLRETSEELIVIRDGLKELERRI